MKKFLFFAALCAAFLSCSKSDDNGGGNNTPPAPSYEQRLEGTWQLQAVTYAGFFPNPTDPLNNINIAGEGEDVTGSHTMARNPNEISYGYSFVANIDPFNTGMDIPLEVNEVGAGEWTVSGGEDKIFITEDGETTTWTVLTNEASKQVYKTRITQTVSGFSVTVDATLTFVK